MLKRYSTIVELQLCSQTYVSPITQPDVPANLPKVEQLEASPNMYEPNRYTTCQDHVGNLSKAQHWQS